MKAPEIAAITIASLIVSFLISHILVLEYLFRHFFGRISTDRFEGVPSLSRYTDQSRELILKSRAELQALPCKEVSVTTDDGLQLVAKYYDFGQKNTVIFLHGFHAHPFGTISPIAVDMMRKGYNLLFPYQRAHGKSEGTYVTYGWKEQYDLLKWIEYVDTETSAENILLYGVSMGGTTVGLASDKIACDKVKALVIDCGFTGIDSLMQNIVETMHVPGKIFLPGIKRRLKRRMDMTLDQFDLSESIRNDKLPTLFVYGGKDYLVSRKSFEKMYEACPTEKELVTDPNSGHAATIIDGRDDALRRFYDFVGKYIR